MKISEFIAKTVAAIDEGIEKINEAEDETKRSVYLNDTDGSGAVGITFDIPVDVQNDEPSLFPFEAGEDYSDAPVPRVAFTVRRR